MDDLVWCAASAVIVFGPVWKVSAISLPLKLLAWVMGPVASAGTAALALSWPQVYANHRTALLATLKVLRCGTGLVLTLPYQETLIPLPPEGAGPLQLLPSLLVKGLLLLVTGLGFPLPTGTTVWVQAVGLACFWGTIGGRCRQECAAPHLARLYDATAARLASALVSPAGIARRHDPHPAGQRACVLVQCWVLAVLGLVLPSVLIDWHGATAPGRWRYGSPKLPRDLATAGTYLALFALASALCWKALELVLGWGLRS